MFSLSSEEESNPARRLLSAVISLAIVDCCDSSLIRSKTPRLSDKSYSAFDFFFGYTKICNLYLELLGIDPGSFRERLLRIMWANGKTRDIDENRKRAFRVNYARYNQLKG